MSNPRLKWSILLALVFAGIFAFVLLRREGHQPTRVQADAPGPADLIARGLELLDAQEIEAAKDFWGAEYQAQEYGKVIEGFWDRLNGSSNRWTVLSQLPASIFLPAFGPGQSLPHQVTLLRGGTAGPLIAPPAWESWAEEQAAAGWEITQTEFRHNQFVPGDDGHATSLVYFSAHLLNRPLDKRAILEGDLILRWNGPALERLAEVDASNVELRIRPGPVPFPRTFLDEVQPTEGYFIDPLIVRDLDGDGQLEIIFAAKNRVYRRNETGDWTPENLCANPPRALLTALLHDMDGDGRDDFLYATFDGLHIYPGNATGRFTSSRPVWAAQPRLKYGQVMTSGDADGDGDIDLFLAQYKVPYHQGQMPRPYFDANDGYPSFLLLNDGQANFTDATGASGLAAKRFRRAYSASFADVDSDGDLDLIVVSDFAGVDGWENNGSGKFTSATTRWFPEPHALGMAHQFADFDADGSLDFLMIGMNSPVADRLEHLGLSRPYPIRDQGKRAALTFGNRLYFATGNGHPDSATTPLPVRRTGWSWGAAAADFDNDGFPDLYIANGHETRQSVVEYEPHFWLHDIYVGSSQENALTEAWFQRKFQQTRGQGHSYGGYERNRFLLNRGGTNWTEVGHLFGVALGEDSRNVLAEDLNGDGRLDLLVTTFEIWPQVKQTLQVFENRLEQTGNWVALDASHLPPGTKILLENPRRTAQIITGDSYRSQSSGRLHFGLGANLAPAAASIQSPKKPPANLTNLQVNTLFPVTK